MHTHIIIIQCLWFWWDIYVFLFHLQPTKHMTQKKYPTECAWILTAHFLVHSAEFWSIHRKILFKGVWCGTHGFDWKFGLWFYIQGTYGFEMPNFWLPTVTRGGTFFFGLNSGYVVYGQPLIWCFEFFILDF